MRKCAKILYSHSGHRRQYGSCALSAGYLRLQHRPRICTAYSLCTKQWLQDCASLLHRTRIACPFQITKHVTSILGILLIALKTVATNFTIKQCGEE